MKTLVVLAALAVATSAHAGKQFEMPNKAGGVIVLTDRPAANANCGTEARQAYTTSATGSPLFGCWVLMDNRVWIKYPDGAVRVHDPDDFVEKNNDNPYRRQSAPEKSTGM